MALGVLCSLYCPALPTPAGPLFSTQSVTDCLLSVSHSALTLRH